VSTEDVTAQPRRQRDDAARNRGRLLDAAGALVAEHGIAVPLDEVARRAGVSSGTLYRHFPSRDELLRALFDRVFDRTEELTYRVLEVPHAWQAILDYIDGLVALAAEFPETATVIAWVRQQYPGYRTGGEWVGQVIALVERAQADGDLRSDVTATDVSYAPHLLLGILRFAEPERGMLLARMRALVIDSLRPEGAGRPPIPTTPLSVQQLQSLSASRASNDTGSAGASTERPSRND
jgi:AcrR family transcriptional regulator